MDIETIGPMEEIHIHNEVAKIIAKYRNIEADLWALIDTANADRDYLLSRVRWKKVAEEFPPLTGRKIEVKDRAGDVDIVVLEKTEYDTLYWVGWRVWPFDYFPEWREI